MKKQFSYQNRICIWLLMAVSIVACTDKRGYRTDCIDYIDSLRINLGDTTLRVAFIKPDIDYPVRPYPFVYEDCLVVLNKADAFYALYLDCFDRDSVFESQLNKKAFYKAFLLNSDLYAVDKDSISYIYNKEKKEWDRKEIDLPFGDEIPLYEDNKYVCYSVCHGEFGGAVFFYNKATRKTTFIPSSCAVAVIKGEDGYQVVSSLSHMAFTSSVVSINNPDSLYAYPDSLFIDEGWRKMQEHKLVELIDNDTNANQEDISLDFFGFDQLITSAFIYNNQYYYITKTYDGVCFSQLQRDSTGATIKIEHTLEFPDYEPITYRKDKLDTIPVPTSIFPYFYHLEDVRTAQADGMTIINYAYRTNEPELRYNYSYINLLETTFIQRDSSLIRIDWSNWK